MNGVACFKSYKQRDIFLKHMQVWIGAKYFYTDRTLPIVRFFGISKPFIKYLVLAAMERHGLVLDSLDSNFL